MTTFSLNSVLKGYPLSVLTCIAIWILSLAPIGKLEIVQNANLSDKWAHFIMYGGLVLVIWGEWLWHRRRSGGETAGHSAALFSLAVWVYVGTVAMSGLLELLQAYCTTYRSGDWIDLAANAIGAALGTVLGLLATLLLRQKRQ